MRSTLVLLLAPACLALPVAARSACPACIDYASNPVEPIVGALDITDDPFDIEVRGDLAYLVTDNRYVPDEPITPELVVVDLSDPAHPIRLGAVESPWGKSALDVEGNYAYVCNPSLAKIDVTDPTDPRLTGHYDFATLPGESALKVDVEEGFGYVAVDLEGASTGRIRSFDLRGEDPILLGVLDLPVRVSDLIVRGPLLYAVGLGRLWIGDVSDPAHPETLSETGLEFLGTDVGLIGDAAVVSIFGRQSAIFDVTDPAVPTLITRGPSLGVFETSGNLIYHPNGSSLRVLDLSDPAHPRVVGSASGVLAFFLDVDGCRVTTVSPFLPEELRIMPAHCMETSSAPADPGIPLPDEVRDAADEVALAVPNPAGGAVTLHFGALDGGPARAWIHDTAGRLIRRLDAPHAAGTIVWDRRDERGRRAGAGLYLYHVRWTGGSASGRVVLLD